MNFLRLSAKSDSSPGIGFSFVNSSRLYLIYSSLSFAFCIDISRFFRCFSKFFQLLNNNSQCLVSGTRSPNSSSILIWFTGFIKP